MQVRYEALVSILFRLKDAAVVVLCWRLAYWARFFLPSIVALKELPPFHALCSARAADGRAVDRRVPADGNLRIRAPSWP